MQTQFRFSELIDFLKTIGEVSDDYVIEKDFFITGFSPITDTREGTISWFKTQHLTWTEIKASVLICSVEATMPNKHDSIFIQVKQPRKVFAQILKRFYVFVEKTGIESTVKMGINCKVGKDVYIGNYVVIGDNVTIGDKTKIYSNVTIYDKVTIGSECIVNSGVVIGADGFGYEKDENGDYYKFPHIGGVTIEDRVEIGSNTCIDRGVLADTVIKENAKIDNLCHIAHNVIIGRNSMVIAQTMLGGSVSLGDNAWIAPGAIIKNGINVKTNALVGLGAVVLKDVDADDIVAGIPAKSLKSQ